MGLHSPPPQGDLNHKCTNANEGPQVREVRTGEPKHLDEICGVWHEQVIQYVPEGPSRDAYQGNRRPPTCSSGPFVELVHRKCHHKDEQAQQQERGLDPFREDRHKPRKAAVVWNEGHRQNVTKERKTASRGKRSSYDSFRYLINTHHKAGQPCPSQKVFTLVPALQRLFFCLHPCRCWSVQRPATASRRLAASGSSPGTRQASLDRPATQDDAPEWLPPSSDRR